MAVFRAKPATYRFWFADLLTGALVADVRLSDPSWSDPLAGAGTFTGRLSLAGREAQAARFTDEVLPLKGKLGLWVIRQGWLPDGTPSRTVPWAGLYEEDDYSSTDRALTVSAVQVDAWLDKQLLSSTITASAGSARWAVIRSLLDHVQNKPGGNLRVTADGAGGGDLTAAVTLDAADRPTVGQLLAEYAAGAGQAVYGFDGLLLAGDVPAFRLRLAPRVDPAAATLAADRVFAYPGNVLSYRAPDSRAGLLSGVTVYADDPDTQVRTVRSWTSTRTLPVGYPRREASSSVSGEAVTAATLDEAAARQGVASEKLLDGPRTLTLDVDPDLEPTAGTYRAGDYARVIIARGDPRFPAGFDRTCRIVQVDGRASTRSSRETATVAVETA